jgi:putative methyltransferase
MSLYHEAAGILVSVGDGSKSLKSEVFGKKTWKTDVKTLFALTSEAAKWSSILSEVVEKSGILKLERQVRQSASNMLKRSPDCKRLTCSAFTNFGTCPCP